MKEENESTALLEKKRRETRGTAAKLFTLLGGFLVPVSVPIMAKKITNKAAWDAFLSGLAQGREVIANSTLNIASTNLSEIPGMFLEGTAEEFWPLALPYVVACIGLPLTFSAFYQLGLTREKKWLLAGVFLMCCTAGFSVGGSYVNRMSPDIANLLGYLLGYCSTRSEELFCNNFNSLTNDYETTISHVESLKTTTAGVAVSATFNVVAATLSSACSYFWGKYDAFEKKAEEKTPIKSQSYSA